LEAYEDDGPEPEDNEAIAAMRVASMLRKEADRRMKHNALENAIREATKKFPGVSPTEIRRHVKARLKEVR
jgi:hypothetical protein